MSNKRKLPMSPFVPGQRSDIDMRPGADKVDGTPGPGSINAYVCDTCNKLTVVIHVDAGVTPMFLACRTTENCEGTGMSLGYPAQHAIPDRIREAAVWEWYRPEKKDPIMRDPGMADHIKQGGLALRPKE